MTRDATLARARVELANTLVADHDPLEYLYTLVERCVEVLNANAAGALLMSVSSLELGYRGVQAHPLQLRDERLGALSVFSSEPGRFSAGDLQAFAVWSATVVVILPLLRADIVRAQRGRILRCVARGDRAGRRGTGLGLRPDGVRLPGATAPHVTPHSGRPEPDTAGTHTRGTG